jgi:hypothetical protein
LTLWKAGQRQGAPSQLPFPRDKREDTGHHTYAPPATSHVPRDRAPCTPPPIHPLSSKQRVMRADDSPLRGPGITSRSPTSITYQIGIAGLHWSGSSTQFIYGNDKIVHLHASCDQLKHRPSLGPGRPGHPHPRFVTSFSKLSLEFPEKSVKPETRAPAFVTSHPPHSHPTNREG